MSMCTVSLLQFFSQSFRGSTVEHISKRKKLNHCRLLGQNISHFWLCISKRNESILLDNEWISLYSGMSKIVHTQTKQPWKTVYHLRAGQRAFIRSTVTAISIECRDSNLQQYIETKNWRCSRRIARTHHQWHWTMSSSNSSDSSANFPHHNHKHCHNYSRKNWFKLQISNCIEYSRCNSKFYEQRFRYTKTEQRSLLCIRRVWNGTEEGSIYQSNRNSEIIFSTVTTMLKSTGWLSRTLFTLNALHMTMHKNSIEIWMHDIFRSPVLRIFQQQQAEPTLGWRWVATCNERKMSVCEIHI